MFFWVGVICRGRQALGGNTSTALFVTVSNVDVDVDVSLDMEERGGGLYCLKMKY